MIDLLWQLFAAQPPDLRPVASVPLFTSGEVISIIGAITTSALAIIAALNARKTVGEVKNLKHENRVLVKDQNEKLDVLTEQSNGVQTSLRSDNAKLATEINNLYKMLAALSPNTRAMEQAATAVPKITEAVTPHETPEEAP